MLNAIIVRLATENLISKFIHSRGFRIVNGIFMRKITPSVLLVICMFLERVSVLSIVLGIPLASLARHARLNYQMNSSPLMVSRIANDMPIN